MAKKQNRPGKAAGGHDPDYIPHGSEAHAQMLGLRKATADDKLVFETWTLADPTAFGPAAREDFLEAILQQRVRELKMPPAVPQSKNRKAPDYAPPMTAPPPTAG